MELVTSSSVRWADLNGNHPSIIQKGERAARKTKETKMLPSNWPSSGIKWDQSGVSRGLWESKSIINIQFTPSGHVFRYHGGVTRRKRIHHHYRRHQQSM